MSRSSKARTMGVEVHAMRYAILGLAVSGLVWSQSMTEAAAAMAGSSVGSVAGKQVSSGIDNIFKKVNGTTAKAAETGKQAKAPEPLLQVGPGAPKEKPYNVPPPPPAKRQTAKAKSAPRPVAAPVFAQFEDPEPAPVMTRTNLEAITPGMEREKVLALGAPASRITMVEDGHLVEIFRYQDREVPFGIVRLSDGAVSLVRVN